MSKDTTGNAGSETWRPISSAPENTLLLVWQEWGPRLRYIRHGELWDENEILDDSGTEVSHWMPLPDPPTTEKPNE